MVEGRIKPGIRVYDGPYFDYAGVANSNPQAFLFEATRLMFRNNSIFRGAAIGVTGAEDQQVFSILSKLSLFDFHGSRPKHVVQSQLIKKRLFSAFQFAGRVGWQALVKSRRQKAESRAQSLMPPAAPSNGENAF